MEGTRVRLEHWSPRIGCWAEEEERKEVWVRIVGLPISLWSPEILKRVGDECGGFITVDEQTKSMGELQWAKILVRLRGEFRPSVLEIEVEEEIYVVSLWWECWPVLRRKRRNEASRHSSEVRGEEVSRAGQRVTKEWVSVRLETLNLSDEGTDVQGVGSGRVEVSTDLSPTTRTWALTGELNPLSPIAAKGDKEGWWAWPDERVHGLEEERSGCNPIVKRRPKLLKGLHPTARSRWKTKGGPKIISSPRGDELSVEVSRSSYPPESETFVARESEDTRKLQGVVRLTETDRALEEESMRYGMGSSSWGKGHWGILISILFFLSNSGGEFYDHSGDLNEEVRADNSMWLTVYEACNERITECKELGVIKS
ncbi:hypothetical protein CK203_041668 [Vitis vinifera]|uniref:Uncharacterized protein n=1 Tax=Vitis vinifera TaxID=29760 RepID=A0A438HCT9_VITVI|nr:hypothetical protein CK203_041668 [Vitis vinifera]